MKKIMVRSFCAQSVGALALLAGLAAAPTVAKADEPIGTMAEVSLLQGWTMENGHYMAALQVKLAPGWHTYWRAPGAAGIPPQFDWSGSRNISGAQFHWPVPEIYEQNGMSFLGYETELVLPIEFTSNGAGNLTVNGEIMMGVCDDVCMPYTAVFQGTFDTSSPAENKHKITSALMQKPKLVSGARCTAQPIEDGMKVTATLNVPKLGAMEVAVMEHPDANIWVSEATSSRKGRTVTVQSDMVPQHAAPFFVDRSKLRITMIGTGGRAYEAQGCSGS
jgi:DsbC/DsbD-like thiol-disulfide interchange protein